MTTVKVNVYNIAPSARRIPLLNLKGIWHTGVVAFEREFYFGCGICEEGPGVTCYGSPCETIDFGISDRNEQEFRQFLLSLSNDKYQLNSYNLFWRNCNHFSHECLLFLCGKGLRQDILELPIRVLRSPVAVLARPFWILGLKYFKYKFPFLDTRSYDPRYNAGRCPMMSLCPEGCDIALRFSVQRLPSLYTKSLLDPAFSPCSVRVPIFVDLEKRLSLGLFDADLKVCSQAAFKILLSHLEEFPVRWSKRESCFTALVCLSSMVEHPIANLELLRKLVMTACVTFLEAPTQGDPEVYELESGFMLVLANALSGPVFMCPSVDKPSIDEAACELVIKSIEKYQHPLVSHRLIRALSSVVAFNLAVVLVRQPPTDYTERMKDVLFLTLLHFYDLEANSEIALRILVAACILFPHVSHSKRLLMAHSFRVRSFGDTRFDRLHRDVFSLFESATSTAGYLNLECCTLPALRASGETDGSPARIL